jgi:hypothetical protein
MFYTEMDVIFDWLPQWKISSQVRKTIFSACGFRGKGPEPGEPVGSPVGDGKHNMRKVCNVYPIHSSSTICPTRVWGIGLGKNMQQASKNAERSANSVVPQGCNKRHCHER